MTFEDSFTGMTNQNVSVWAQELRKNNQWLQRAKQKEIIESMNKRELICTAGFLLRQQIQQHFPKIMEEAAKNSKIPLEDCADLSKAGNVPWDEKFTKALANVLASEKACKAFSGYDAKKKILEARQWFNYLQDETRPQREMAIKLIFALKMDDATASKFLISADHNLFSVRNPFDYICNFCLTCDPRFTYAEACEMLSEFEKNLPKEIPAAAAAEKDSSNATEEMTNEISNIAKGSNIDPKAKLLAYMKKKSAEFVRKVPKKNQRDKAEGEREMEYPSGFSRSNIEQLEHFTEYLVMLYPQIDSSGVRTVTDAQGREVIERFSTLNDLVEEMYCTQGIRFKENAKLNLPSKGAALNAYNKIPLNKDVVLQLKNLSETLRAIMRASTHPANAQDISRGTIMILAYFFITGYLYAENDVAENFSEKLRQDENNAKGLKKKIIQMLRNVTEQLDEIADSDEPVKDFKAALNVILTCFHFTNFYPPFVLDRFVMLCLLADPLSVNLRNKSLPFLMQLVITRNYMIHINKNQTNGGEAKSTAHD